MVLVPEDPLRRPLPPRSRSRSSRSRSRTAAAAAISAVTAAIAIAAAAAATIAAAQGPVVQRPGGSPAAARQYCVDAATRQGSDLAENLVDDEFEPNPGGLLSPGSPRALARAGRGRLPPTAAAALLSAYASSSSGSTTTGVVAPTTSSSSASSSASASFAAAAHSRAEAVLAAVDAPLLLPVLRTETRSNASLSEVARGTVAAGGTAEGGIISLTGMVACTLPDVVPVGAEGVDAFVFAVGPEGDLLSSSSSGGGAGAAVERRLVEVAVEYTEGKGSLELAVDEVVFAAAAANATTTNATVTAVRQIAEVASVQPYDGSYSGLHRLVFPVDVYPDQGPTFLQVRVVAVPTNVTEFSFGGVTYDLVARLVDPLRACGPQGAAQLAAGAGLRDPATGAPMLPTVTQDVDVAALGDLSAYGVWDVAVTACADLALRFPLGWPATGAAAAVADPNAALRLHTWTSFPQHHDVFVMAGDASLALESSSGPLQTVSNDWAAAEEMLVATPLSTDASSRYTAVLSKNGRPGFEPLNVYFGFTLCEPSQTAVTDLGTLSNVTGPDWSVNATLCGGGFNATLELDQGLLAEMAGLALNTNNETRSIVISVARQIAAVLPRLRDQGEPALRVALLNATGHEVDRRASTTLNRRNAVVLDEALLAATNATAVRISVELQDAMSFDTRDNYLERLHGFNLHPDLTEFGPRAPVELGVHLRALPVPTAIKNADQCARSATFPPPPGSFPSIAVPRPGEPAVETLFTLCANTGAEANGASLEIEMPALDSGTLPPERYDLHIEVELVDVMGANGTSPDGDGAAASVFGGSDDLAFADGVATYYVPQFFAFFPGSGRVTFTHSTAGDAPSVGIFPFGATSFAANLILFNRHGFPLTVRVRTHTSGCTPDSLTNNNNEYGFNAIQLVPSMTANAATGRAGYASAVTCRADKDHWRVELAGGAVNVNNRTMDDAGVLSTFVRVAPQIIGSVQDPTTGDTVWRVDRYDLTVLNGITDAILGGANAVEGMSQSGRHYVFNFDDLDPILADTPLYVAIEGTARAAALYDVSFAWRNRFMTTEGAPAVVDGGDLVPVPAPEPTTPTPPPPGSAGDGAGNGSEDDTVLGVSSLLFGLLLAILIVALCVLCLFGALLLRKRNDARKGDKNNKDGSSSASGAGGEGGKDQEELDVVAGRKSRHRSADGQKRPHSHRHRHHRSTRGRRSGTATPAAAPATMERVKRLKNVELSEKIGEGNFGAVFRAVLAGAPVAAKSINTATADNLKEIEDELLVLMEIDHPNCVHFLGLYHDEAADTDYMIFELADGGSVLSLFQRSEVTAERKLRILRDAARGVAYLASQDIVHRDLACRNLLLDRDRTLISDFGLSRRYEGDFYKTKSRANMPVRWSAPEVLLQGVATVASDVFSFATLAWEVFEGGDTPFAGMSNQEVSRVLRRGQASEHLTQPEDCPDDVYTEMKRMWVADAGERPPITDILAVLEGYVVDAPPSGMVSPSPTTPLAYQYQGIDETPLPARDREERYSMVFTPASGTRSRGDPTTPAAQQQQQQQELDGPSAGDYDWDGDGSDSSSSSGSSSSASSTAEMEDRGNSSSSSSSSDSASASESSSSSASGSSSSASESSSD